jgi:hypothetical protein
MSNENLLKLFPNKRVKPYDGMSVTADVWQQAHEYHKQYNQAHNLFFHGSGILIGMEVVASDPPDSMVFILPGVAVDPNGKVIVLADPVAYDLGDEIDGPLYLTIIQRESSTSLKKNNDGSGLAFIQDEFLITARQSVPEKTMVELARFTRKDRKSVIKVAESAQGPKINEIDLRFRRQIAMQIEQLLTAGVVYLGTKTDHVQGAGLIRLAQSVRRTDNINLVVNDNLELDPGILSNSFLYLVGKGKFQLTKAQVNGLQGYIKRGGFLLMESCDAQASDSFTQLAKDIELELSTSPSKGDRLLSEPHYFAVIPTGFESDGNVVVGDGGLFSTFNYGALWSGESKDTAPSRENIRTAFEWGSNLLHFILDFKEKFKGN